MVNPPAFHDISMHKKITTTKVGPGSLPKHKPIYTPGIIALLHVAKGKQEPSMVVIGVRVPNFSLMP